MVQSNKQCCIFNSYSVEEVAKKIGKQLKTVKDFGDTYIRPDGSFNTLHDLDYGGRELMKCEICGALLLWQSSRCPVYYDGYPLETNLYYSVNSKNEADEINDKYSGFEFEYKYLDNSKNAWIWCMDGEWRWSKDEANRKKMEKNILEIARTLAKELHSGQTDKVGKDYFSEHLCRVADMGAHWLEKAVGYLHDAAEDTPYSEEQVLQMLQERSGEQLRDDDAKDILEALTMLNSKTASSREEYIARFCQEDGLAVAVKLNDLSHNMDITRFENPTERDFERVKRYKNEYKKIYKALCKRIDDRVKKYSW